MTTKELEHQVAGHKGVQTDDSGELVYKVGLSERRVIESCASIAWSSTVNRSFSPLPRPLQ